MKLKQDWFDAHELSSMLLFVTGEKSLMELGRKFLKGFTFVGSLVYVLWQHDELF